MTVASVEGGTTTIVLANNFRLNASKIDSFPVDELLESTHSQSYAVALEQRREAQSFAVSLPARETLRSTIRVKILDGRRYSADRCPVN